MHPLALTLALDTEQPCVSVYMPTLPGIGFATQNVEHLHRLLLEAEPKLGRFGIEGKAQSQFLAPARAFADEQLSQGVKQGTLALFLSPSTFEVRMLPIEMQDRLIVGPRFSITPLLPHLYGSMHYYLLAVSANSAHFIEVQDGEMEGKEIPNMPHSVAEAWAGTEHDEESQTLHATVNGAVSSSGHANAKDAKEIEHKVYLQKIEKSLHTFLREQQLPLIFVGVQEMFGVYRSLDTSGRLLDQYIHGSPEHLEAEEILSKADPIIREESAKRIDRYLEDYGNLSGTGRTSTDLALILDAAAIGKVERLYVAEGQEQWGTFDLESGRKELHDSATGGGDELIGLCALHTLRHRGFVATVPLAKMPEGKQIAAILRH